MRILNPIEGKILTLRLGYKNDTCFNPNNNSAKLSCV